MTPTPVGMRCPECSRERTKVKTIRSGAPVPTVTQALIAINVIVFLAESASGGSVGSTGGGSVFTHGALLGPPLTGSNPFPPPYNGTHEYWRLLTAGFLHAGLIHLLFNMIFLYFMGQILEPAIGRLNFAFVYFAALLAGSFGALLFTPDSPTVGASGACFGILGALLVVARARRIPIWQSGLGVTLAFNLIFSVSVSGISIGGHLGGLIGGIISGYLIVELAERRRMQSLALLGCALVAVVSVVGALAVAGQTGLAPNGVGFG